MAGTEPGSAREEAERLVAALLATTRLAAAAGPAGGAWGPLGGILSGVLGHTGDRFSAGSGAPRPGREGGGGFATGTPECCICPVCRGIAALRDPDPEFAERLATGAGDLAAGVASLLRAFAPTGAEPGTTRAAAPTAGDHAGAAGSDPTPRAGGPGGDHVWREATRTGHDSQPAPEQDVWSAATRGEGAADPGAEDGSGSRRGVSPAEPELSQPADGAGPDAPGTIRSPAGRPVVPASRASGEVGGDAAGDGA
ncbi:hypothetical protein [Micromonospora mirobrigensis]|uniref:Uncharacterized protein n=1 Tax=Micromonospora mirobrigensis TaxID=262898 RepID=A0A1C5A6Y4_9ACTN|nr:hypothetical protein [Micromonospora mirobrigensis]SCF40980.1 hypothetical protein GA0070564_10843 [Micromonospora mirobrigensis]